MRLRYHRELDHAVEALCANAFARMVNISSHNQGMAGVRASMWILAVKAKMVEPTRLEVDEPGRGITGLLKLLDDAKNQPDYEEPDLDAMIAEAKKQPDWPSDVRERTYPLPAKPH